MSAKNSFLMNHYNPTKQKSSKNVMSAHINGASVAHSSLSNPANINQLVTGSSGGAQSLLESYRTSAIDQQRTFSGSKNNLDPTKKYDPGEKALPSFHTDVQQQ